MTNEEIKITNKTARSKGIIGKNALLPRIIINKFPYREAKILDFGSGPNILQTKHLKKEGYEDITPFEIGDNHIDGIHFSGSLSERIEYFDIVFASNVINTLPSISAIKETIGMMELFTSKEGFALINYPKSPRKCEELTLEKLKELLMEVFKSVMIENHNGTRIFYCYKQEINDV